MESGENKRKHLELIQNVITRMGANSFMVKGGIVTIIAALLVLAPDNANSTMLYIFCIVIAILFWGIDGFFLATERCYIALYNYVRTVEEDKIDFAMNAKRFAKGRNRFICATLSKTLIPFYLPIVVIGIVMVWQSCVTATPVELCDCCC